MPIAGNFQLKGIWLRQEIKALSATDLKLTGQLETIFLFRINKTSLLKFWNPIKRMKNNMILQTKEFKPSSISYFLL